MILAVPEGQKKVSEVDRFNIFWNTFSLVIVFPVRLENFNANSRTLK